MRYPPSWSCIAILCLVSDVALAQEAPNRFEQLLGRAQSHLKQLAIDAARQTLHTAMAWAESPSEYARVWDLLGTSEGLDAHYGQAFEAFFRAARLGGGDAVQGVRHPQLPTRRTAECAVRLEQSGFSWTSAERRLRQASGDLRGQQSLDELLATELFAERFVCPSASEPGDDVLSEAEGGVVGREALPPEEPDRLMPREVVVPSVDTFQLEGEGPPVMTWVLGAMALAAMGTGATLGVVNLSQRNGAPGTVDQPSSSAVGPNVWVDTPAASNVAFAVAGGAALGAILFWVLDVGQNNDDDETVLFPSGVQVRW